MKPELQGNLLALPSVNFTYYQTGFVGFDHLLKSDQKHFQNANPPSRPCKDLEVKNFSLETN